MIGPRAPIRADPRAHGAPRVRGYVDGVPMGRARRGTRLATWVAAVALPWLAGTACRTGAVTLDENGDRMAPHPPLAAIHDPAHANHAAPPPPDARLTMPARTPQLATYPCMEQCHKDRTPVRERRPLIEYHTLKRVLHGDSDMWCDFCHDLDDLDRLRLLAGGSVSFDESPTLCGQCHGDKLRDFELGIHGLQTGHFRGDRVRRACTACHDPHAPKRPNFTALPAPKLREGVP